MVVTYALQKGMLVCSHYIVKIDGNILIVEGLQVTTKNFATDWPDDTWSKKVHCYEGNLLCRECLHCHNVSLDVHPMVHDEKKGQCYEGHLFCSECIRRHNFPTKQTELKPKPNMEAVKCMCQQRIGYILAV